MMCDISVGGINMDLANLMNQGYLNFESVRIAVIGDCMLDIYHYGEIERISPEAPVPIFKANNTEPEYRLGGALNLAKLGVKVSLFGFIGKDVNATYIKSYLLEYGIDYHLFELSGFPTITKNRYFAKNQQIIRIDQENTDGEVYDPELQTKLANSVINRNDYFDAIILSDYGKGALYHTVLNSILSYCSESLPIFVDPKLTDWGHYKGAFCITPNWKEFKDACHAPNLKLDLHEILKYAQDQCLRHNIEYILITLGSEGMTLINKDGHIISKTAKVAEIYDVSGAGDTVIATLAAAYCKNYPMGICIRLATMAAKVVIEHLGTYAITDSELNIEILNHINKKGK
jgi:D-beta-D-heptose 7-phosphate kinase/D-beta-D-heptose 1-phosphate adenosyltransferase